MTPEPNNRSLTITARCVEPNPRIRELYYKPSPLTPAEWAELHALERKNEEKAA